MRKPRILLAGNKSLPDYVDAFTAAGAQPEAMYLPPVDTDYDGLVLCGGCDIDPKYYGAEMAGSRDIDEARDTAEFALLKAYVQLGKPVMGTHVGTKLGTPWMDREGTSNVCMQFESGALGYHFGTWGARGTKHRYDFQAHCEQGLIDLDFHAGKLTFRCKDPEHVPGVAIKSEETVLMEADHAKPTAIEMAHFIDCIETGKTPDTTPEDSLEGLRVIWKLYDAEENCQIANLRGLGF